MNNRQTAAIVRSNTAWQRALGVALLGLSAASTTQAQPRSGRAPTFAPGDLDGDGYGDLVVPGGSGIQVFFGGREGPSERPVVLAHPFLFGGQETRFADAIEDLDGDGDAELVVVDFAADPWAVGATVSVHVYEGGTRALGVERWSGGWRTALGVFHESQACLRAAGDVDGDGRADVVAAGFVLFGGARESPQRSHAVQAGSTPGEQRRAVLPIGDTDGDGRAELWTAPVRRDTPPPFYGATGLRGSAGVRVSTDASGAWRASPLPLFADATGSVHLVDVRAVDLDGDRVDELLGS